MRKRIESALGRWGLFVARNAWTVLFLTLAGSSLLATQLQFFRLDTSLESYFHADDPVMVEYERYQDLFGRDATIVIALEPSGGVFEADFLDTLRAIHEAIEDEVPLLEDVTSLVNVRETLGDEEGLQVDDFLAIWPESEEALQAARTRALANPLYRNYVLSADGRVTTIVLEIQHYREVDEADVFAGFGEDSEALANAADEPALTTGEDDKAILAAVYEVLERHAHDDLEYHVAGIPALNASMSVKMEWDMAVFTGLCLGLIAFFLAVLFRRLAGVILPIVTVVLAVLMALSVMALTDTPLMPPSQNIPPLLLAVGIGGAVHLITMFYQARRRGEETEAAIGFAIRHSGLPIIMTSLTTAGGLISFMPAALAPISHFGWVTPIGVLISLFFTLTLLPALMAIIPMRPSDAKQGDTISQRALVAVGVFSIQRRGLVLLVWAGLICGSAAGISRLQLGNDMVKWFPPHDEMRRAIEYINHEVGGAASVEILVEGKAENALHDPALLERIDDVHDLTEGFEFGGVRADKVVSIVDVVKETHRALNENRETHYAIPDDRRLVSQELLLFENSGSDDVEDLVSSQFDIARMSIRVPLLDASYYSDFMDALIAQAETRLGTETDMVLTGAVALLGRTVTAALDTMIRSYAMALFVITVLMTALLGSLRIGLLSMLPNLAPVVFALGLMGWLGIKIDMLNLMLGSIVIGLAVDDTIHFMHNFRRELEATGNATTAVENTLRGTGQALLFTSFVLASGFLVYTQAYLDMLFNFGLLTAMAIGVAFLADATLAPALVGLVDWEKRRRDEER